MYKHHFYSARKFASFINRSKFLYLFFIIIALIVIYRLIWMRINRNGLNTNDEVTEQPTAGVPVPMMPNSPSNTTIFSRTSERKVDEMMELNMLDCQRIFNGDKIYAMEIKHSMLTDPSESEMPMDCESIRRRNGLPGKWTNVTQEEIEFPLAFARIVNQDYLMIEMELATNYAQQNWYCFAVDTKAKPQFRARMHQLASCFPNVILTQRELAIHGSGHNTTDAMMECAEELAQPERQWKYLITLQNHDIQAKTNAEMVRIFQWLDGANDIEIGNLEWATIKERLGFYETNFDWTFKALKLFKNDIINHGTDSTGNPLELHLSKGYSMASLSRPFVDFIVHELNLDSVLAQLNQGRLYVDEHLWQMLSTTDALNAPGGFPQQCQRYGVTPYITRYALWGTEDSSNKVFCRSEVTRHGICVYGIEDLVEPGLRELPHLFVNKMMPEYDFDAINCWHQWMRQKRLNHSELNLNPKPYTNWPQTKYNQQQNLTKEINCTLYYT